jgi:hypothetical protein
MKSAQLVEAHKAAALAYGKLYRTILTELSLHRSSRSNPIAFLKMIRSEQDRLQETSPTVLPHIIAAFNARFKENTHLQKPEITGDLDHIVIPLLGPHTPSEPPSPTTTPVALDIRGDAPSAIAIAIESPDVTTGAAKRASSAVVSTRMPSPNESL